MAYSVAILGFHRIASSLLHDLGRKYPGIMSRILVVDFNVGLHSRISDQGAAVKYGDLSNRETLHHAGVDKAKVIACTVPDDVLKGTSNRQIVEAARHVYPDAIIIANEIELAESKRLYDAGADYVFLQHIEAANAVCTAIEKALSGEIATHRESIESVEGKWHLRKEVL